MGWRPGCRTMPGMREPVFGVLGCRAAPRRPEQRIYEEVLFLPRLSVPLCQMAEAAAPGRSAAPRAQDASGRCSGEQVGQFRPSIPRGRTASPAWYRCPVSPMARQRGTAKCAERCSKNTVVTEEGPARGPTRSEAAVSPKGARSAPRRIPRGRTSPPAPGWHARTGTGPLSARSRAF